MPQVVQQGSLLAQESLYCRICWDGMLLSKRILGMLEYGN